MTKHTICEPDSLTRELDQVRERGYAYDEEEFALGVSCVAAPILHNRHLIAALGLSVPTERFRERRADLTSTLLEIVQRAAAAGPNA